MNKVSEDAQQDKSLQADILTTDLLRAQLDGMRPPEKCAEDRAFGFKLSSMLSESRRREDQLQQEKVLAVQKLQTLRQLYLVHYIKP